MLKDCIVFIIVKISPNAQVWSTPSPVLFSRTGDKIVMYLKLSGFFYQFYQFYSQAEGEKEGEFDFPGYETIIFQTQIFLLLKPEKHKGSYLCSP